MAKRESGERPEPERDEYRMNFRVPASVRKVIELAARAAGESLTQYILRAALARARVLVMEPSLLDRAEEDLRQAKLRF